MLIPAAVLGIISGGVVMNKLRPSLTGASKLLILLNFIPTIALATLFALGCDSVSIVGVTETYNVRLATTHYSSVGMILVVIHVIHELRANVLQNVVYQAHRLNLVESFSVCTNIS